MSSRYWPGTEVRAALAGCRVVKRQALVLAALVCAAAAAIELPLRLHRGPLRAVVMLGLVALVLEGLILLHQRDRLHHATDALILGGFARTHGDEAVGRQVARRLAELRSPAFRRGLARNWRELLSVASREPRIAQYPRPYISSAAVRENAPTIARIIVALERGPANPVAELRLCRQWQRLPLPAGAPERQRRNRERFAHELAAIAEELSIPPGAG